MPVLIATWAFSPAFPTSLWGGRIFQSPYPVTPAYITSSFLIVAFSHQVLLYIYCVKDMTGISTYWEACIKNKETKEIWLLLENETIYEGAVMRVKASFECHAWRFVGLLIPEHPNMLSFCSVMFYFRRYLKWGSCLYRLVSYVTSLDHLFYINSYQGNQILQSRFSKPAWSLNL